MKGDYVRYSVQDKLRFFYVRTEKVYECITSSDSIMCAPDSIFESCKSVDRKCILTKEHKATVIKFIDANPSCCCC